MINEIISSIVQITVFTAIPFIVYVVQKRTFKGFFRHLGFKRSTLKANLFAFLGSLLFVLPILTLAFLNSEFREIITAPDTVIGKIQRTSSGMETVLLILLVAIFKTSLSEEIFFRGFIAKGLINMTTYQVGNILQAILFGALHSVLFFAISQNFVFLSIIFFFPTMGAYLTVYLNEKMADGSIIPGWIAHAVANVMSYTIVVFLI